ncbi:unnamed protein product [Symbiodinium sp. CCMP2592]|nr:unnamed protein product [Symbiodinium sp. CCMP2592]
MYRRRVLGATLSEAGCQEPHSSHSSQSRDGYEESEKKAFYDGCPTNAQGAGGGFQGFLADFAAYLVLGRFV